MACFPFLSSHKKRRRRIVPAVLSSLLLFVSLLTGRASADANRPQILLSAVGDSLTQGTMDAANHAFNTWNAYLHRISESLAQVSVPLFSEPLLNLSGTRLFPFRTPTNLGVDGADIFSIEGIEYYKRVGAKDSVVSPSYLCDKRFPPGLKDSYDKVLYPLNLLAGQPVSQMDALRVLLDRLAAEGASSAHALVIFWAGNNDSSLAALGTGGANPVFLPFPLEQIAPQLSPGLRDLLDYGREAGILRFDPYTVDAIERNLTEHSDFTDQYHHILTRLEEDSLLPPERRSIFCLTLPHYSAVGYLFDSEDLEYYLRKIDPDYTVPPTFSRVAPPGEPVTDPTRGDRISLFTFGFMYMLLHTGYSADYVNQALEIDGIQNDGLVLSEAEQRMIMDRVDGFNRTIIDAAAAGPSVQVLDIAGFLNAVLTGKTPIELDGRILSRKWSRGGSFCLDGVHPGFTGHALIANRILETLNERLGLAAPLHDLEAVMLTDPYVDRDGDGWVPGPLLSSEGLTELLLLFRDPDDTDPARQVELPPDVWQSVSRILLEKMLAVPTLPVGPLRRPSSGRPATTGEHPRSGRPVQQSHMHAEG